MKGLAMLRVGRCCSGRKSCFWSARERGIHTFFVGSSPSSPLRLLSAQFPTKSISPFPSTSSSYSLAVRLLNTKPPPTHNQQDNEEGEQHPIADERSNKETSDTEGWEEEDEREPEIGDGGDGGGVVLGDGFWGERVLSIANEVLVELGDDMKLFSFRTSPRGYIYVRLDKLSDKYGCPTMEEMEKYSSLYKTKLDEVGESGQIPDDLALEVSSPGAERLLKVPDDLDRFKEFPMRVRYKENELDPVSKQKDGIFFLDSVETESEHCVWKLADVKENRNLSGKGRPLNRKQKDWRLRSPFGYLKRVTLYLEY